MARRAGCRRAPSATCATGCARQTAAANPGRSLGGRNPACPAPPRAVGHLLAAKLCTDPALRYTLTGRRLLAGLLAAGAIDDSDLVELARGLPSHCVALIAAAAGDCARTWQQLADTVRMQHSFPEALADRRERVGRTR